MTLVPTLCILHMLSDASETMTQVFGVEIAKRQTWKRPKIGFSSSEVQEMKTPIEPVMVYAPMNDHHHHLWQMKQDHKCIYQRWEHIERNMIKSQMD